MIYRINGKDIRLIAVLFLLLSVLFLAGCGSEKTVDEAEEVTPSPSPTAEPERRYFAGYMDSANGLFYPEKPMTEEELAEILFWECEETFTPRQSELMPDTLYTWLTTVFEPDRVARAMGGLGLEDGDVIRRGECAVCLNRIFGLTEPDAGDYYPDVAPGYWAYDAILIACDCEEPLGSASEPLQAGPRLYDCELYMVGEDGYFLKNAWKNALYFGPDGRYTSGSPELDGYVTEMFRSLGGADMDRETLLRAAYDHIRDDFTYLVRNYYKTGDFGWAQSEAVTMLSTGKGNCYCYASAFWACARALGWNAKAVSGTYGEDEAPHGWVEIYGEEDGRCYTYDPEIEMKSRVAGNLSADLFAMTDAQRSPHEYLEYSFTDDYVPRQINMGSLPE